MSEYSPSPRSNCESDAPQRLSMLYIIPNSTTSNNNIPWENWRAWGNFGEY